MSTAKQQFGYRMWRRVEGDAGGTGKYAHLYLEVIHGWQKNAAKQYEQEATEWNLERLEKIRSLGTDANYLEGGSDDDVLTLTWQTDRMAAAEREQFWYACRVESARVIPAAARVLSLLAKTEPAGYEFRPAEVLELLGLKLKARPVWHGQDAPYAAWIYREADTSLLSEKPWFAASSLQRA